LDALDPHRVYPHWRDPKPPYDYVNIRLKLPAAFWNDLQKAVRKIGIDEIDSPHDLMRTFIAHGAHHVLTEIDPETIRSAFGSYITSLNIEEENNRINSRKDMMDRVQSAFLASKTAADYQNVLKMCQAYMTECDDVERIEELKDMMKRMMS
jgi:hypothetical protein